MSRIYLAASYSRKDEMKGVRDLLLAFQHTITSSWIDHDSSHESSDVSPYDLRNHPEKCCGFAYRDVDELTQSDILIMFTGDDKSSGGRHTEFGMALALGMSVVIIGPRENVFQSMRIVNHWDTWYEFYMYIWNNIMTDLDNVIKDKVMEKE